MVTPTHNGAQAHTHPVDRDRSWRTYSIGEIRLTVGQWPAGQTVHQMWVGTSRDTLQLVYEFKGKEFDFDVLNYVPADTPGEHPLRAHRHHRKPLLGLLA